jgi:hypothetical protein
LIDFFWKGYIRRFAEPLHAAHWFLLPESEMPQLASQYKGCCNFNLDNMQQPDR